MNYKIIFMYIVTFGLYHFYLQKKVKQNIEVKNDRLTIDENPDVDIEQLVTQMGGIENIKDISSTINKFTVSFVDKTKVNRTNIEKMGATGFFETNEQIAFLFGKSSKKIAELIKLKLS